MARIRMGRLDEIAPGQMLEKRILARRIAVVNDDGTLYGIESDCKHMRASLATGSIADGVVTCKWHGWKYDLRTGKCLTVDRVKLKRFDVVVQDGDVFIDT